MEGARFSARLRSQVGVGHNGAMSSGPYLAVVDAGTTGVTALLFDSDLHRVARGYREFPQHFPQPGWVEHSAPEILRAVDEALQEALARVDGTIAAVGVTNQRETIFALDRSRGEVLGPGIVWQDRRTSRRCEELRAEGREDGIRRRTGLVLDPYFSATKAEWLLRQRPEVATAQERGRLAFVTVDALVVHHLTGGEVLATDPTNASRTMLFDIDERAWSVELAETFGVALEALPEVRPSAGSFGEARLPGGRVAPIRGVAGDQQAALFGQACWEPGQVKSTYGTGNFLVLNTGAERRDSDAGLLTTLAADRGGSVCYALEGSVFSCGSVIQWLRDELGLLENAASSEALARSVEDTGGVTLVPAFTGLGAPHWAPEARGAIFGLTRGTGPGHLTRAALEAIAFQCAEVLGLMRSESGLPVEELLVDGGAASNDLLLELQADLADVSVVRPEELETTARGAAALAGVAAGLWADPGDAAAFRSGARRFEPQMEADDRDRECARWARAVRATLAY